MDRSSGVLSTLLHLASSRNAEGRGICLWRPAACGCEWSGRLDLNPRSPGPEPGAIPCFATSRHDAATCRGAQSWLVLRSRTECCGELYLGIHTIPLSLGNCG